MVFELRRISHEDLRPSIFYFSTYVVNIREQRSATTDPCLQADLLALEMKLSGHERIVTESHNVFI